MTPGGRHFVRFWTLRVIAYCLRARLCEGGAKRDMLLELRAENYAVIDRATARFGPGLNLLTGETGAGKSILIDALALLLGGKASADFVRHGADKAIVSCVFEATPGALAVLEDNGIDADRMRKRYCCGGRSPPTARGECSSITSRRR